MHRGVGGGSGGNEGVISAPSAAPALSAIQIQTQIRIEEKRDSAELASLYETMSGVLNEPEAMAGMRIIAIGPPKQANPLKDLWSPRRKPPLIGEPGISYAEHPWWRTREFLGSSGV